MGLLVKLAGRRLPSSQIVLVRAALGAIGINCFYYYSLVHLPLGEATLIQYTNPIFATILAAL